jgi:tRNA (cmo5U34)-methyltransferase
MQQAVIGSLNAVVDRDDLFGVTRARAEDFRFGAETVAVFDDMVDRSVPQYGEVQRMIGELAADFAVDGTSVYDVGCSTCTSFMQIASRLPEDADVRFVGIDSSRAMLKKAAAKLNSDAFAYPYELRNTDLHDGLSIENASVVVLSLTLQFVRPLHRERLLSAIYDGLNEQGCLIVVEKVLGEHSIFNRLFIEHYYEMKKRNGYSDLQIAQKREALENVLVPYRLEENKELLRRAGFGLIDTFFQWYNFSGLIAVKPGSGG